MLQQRSRAAQDGRVSTQIADVDGNMKLNGRICARADAEVKYSLGSTCGWLIAASSSQHSRNAGVGNIPKVRLQRIPSRRRQRRLPLTGAVAATMTEKLMMHCFGQWGCGRGGWGQRHEPHPRSCINTSGRCNRCSNTQRCRRYSCLRTQDPKALEQNKLVRGGRANGWLLAVALDGLQTFFRIGAPVAKIEPLSRQGRLQSAVLYRLPWRSGRDQMMIFTSQRRKRMSNMLLALMT